MESLFFHGAGWDGNQKRMTACCVTPELSGQQTDDLLELQDLAL